MSHFVLLAVPGLLSGILAAAWAARLRYRVPCAPPDGAAYERLVTLADDGEEVFLHASAVPEGAVIRSGSRLEFGVAQGKRGAQALSVRVLDAPPSLSKLNRRSADDMAIVIEDLVKLLDGIGGNLRRGRYPDRAHGAKIAAVLRRVADDLDS